MNSRDGTPTEAPSAAGAVVDAIANIEVLRQATEKAAGFPISRSAALHRLNELLAYENEALRLRGPRSGHQENVEILAIEIGRVKRLGAPAGDALEARSGHRGHGERKASWRAKRGPTGTSSRTFRRSA